MGCGCEKGGGAEPAGSAGSQLWFDLWVPLAPGAVWHLPAERMPAVGNVVGAQLTVEIAGVGAAASEASDKVKWGMTRTAAATAVTTAYEQFVDDQPVARTAAYVNIGLGAGEDETKVPRGFAGMTLRNTSATLAAVVRLRVWLSLQQA